MATLVVVGTQWGDEGKGKVVHLLSEKADYIIRYQGGNNAGHTVVFNGQEFILHLVPAGILEPGKKCIIGSGVVVDPQALVEEIRFLEEKGIKIKGRLLVSDACHIILPYHRFLDELRETEQGKRRIGTTRKGIGPAYADKVARVGIRMADFLSLPLFRKLLDRNLKEKAPLLRQVCKLSELRREIMEKRKKQLPIIKGLVIDSAIMINRVISQGKNIILESAQGTLLDVDYGTYPYVTSSNPVAGGACVGIGIGPTQIDRVLGVVKAYTTRVGEGPFPTELTDGIGRLLRERGKEFGATTGRPRRCGWFDAAIVRHAVRVNGLKSLALTKLDVLDRLDPLRICVAYRYRGRLIREFPSGREIFEDCKPVYINLRGWKERTKGMHKFDSLPTNAKRYLRKIEQLVQAKVSIVSMGRSREETIVIDRDLIDFNF